MPPRTIKEKVREALLAVKVEQELSKDQILAKYLNTVYFGHGAYGAEAAAQTYFAEPATDLTVMRGGRARGGAPRAEPLRPDQEQFDNEFRRDYTLDQMAKYGYITQERAAALKGSRVLRHPRVATGRRVAHRQPAPARSTSSNGPARELFERYGSARVYGGGLQVTTRLDLELQGMAEEAVEDEAAGVRRDSEPESRRRARDDRQRDRRGARDGRWPELEPVEAEPRDAPVRRLRPAGGLGVQAVHPGGGPRDRTSPCEASTGPARRRSRSPTRSAQAPTGRGRRSTRATAPPARSTLYGRTRNSVNTVYAQLDRACRAARATWSTWPGASASSPSCRRSARSRSAACRSTRWR